MCNAGLLFLYKLYKWNFLVLHLYNTCFIFFNSLQKCWLRIPRRSAIIVPKLPINVFDDVAHMCCLDRCKLSTVVENSKVTLLYS